MSHIASTERPRTPPRSGAFDVEGPHPLSEKRSQYLEDKPGYSRHFTDLVYPIQNAESVTKLHIPPTYREAEAVDSSLLLGQGASFSASLQRLPAATKQTVWTTEWDGLPVTHRSPAAARPEFVVYKTARIAFADDGRPLPEYTTAMHSVLTEFHALIYPPLMEHENVIDFLGFAWGSNPFSPSYRLPAIIVEYAEHGTLASIMAKNPDLPSTQRQFLALDVAQGVSALHQSGLVHGDVKADNVLICAHSSREYIAKIADFGFSIVRDVEDAQIYLGGTRPWMAPEVLKGPVSIENLPHTDIFSIGLLFWVIFLGGRSPVDCINGQGSSKTAMFEAMKADGSLLKSALDPKIWLEGFTHAKYAEKIERALDASQTRVKSMAGKTKLNVEQMQTHRPLLRANMFDQMVMAVSKDSFLPRLLKIFKDSLQLEPPKRNLEAVIAELKEGLPSLTRSVSR